MSNTQKSSKLHSFIKAAKSCVRRLGSAGRELPRCYQFSSLLWRLLIFTNYKVILIKWFFFFFQETSVSFTVQSGWYLLNEQLLNTLFLFHCSACVVPFVIYQTLTIQIPIESYSFPHRLFWFHYHVGVHHRRLLSTLWHQGWCNSYQRWRFDMWRDLSPTFLLYGHLQTTLFICRL